MENRLKAALMAAPASAIERSRLVQRGAEHLANNSLLEEWALAHVIDWRGDEGQRASVDAAALLVGGALEGLSVGRLAQLTGWWPVLEDLAYRLDDLGLVRVVAEGRDLKVELL